jgi:hypothetical protein
MRRFQLSLDPASSGLGTAEDEQYQLREVPLSLPAETSGSREMAEQVHQLHTQNNNMLENEGKRNGCIAERKNRAWCVPFLCRYSKLDGLSTVSSH